MSEVERIDRDMDLTPGAGAKRRERKIELTPEGDTETNKLLGKAAVEHGEMAAASRQAARDSKSPTFGTEGEGLHLFPMDETQGFIGDDAAHNLAMAETLRTQRSTENTELAEKTYMYFLRCENGHHGIYFTKKPQLGISVPDDEWFAGYKRKNDVYRMRIVCQVCARIWPKRRPTPLAVRQGEDGMFSPDHEHVWRVPRERARALVEGESRAFDSRLPANNMWRDDMKDKLKEHDYVWID